MQVPGYYVAYVGNIAFEAEADELREVFADCGVTQVQFMFGHPNILDAHACRAPLPDTRL